MGPNRMENRAEVCKQSVVRQLGWRKTSGRHIVCLRHALLYSVIMQHFDSGFPTLYHSMKNMFFQSKHTISPQPENTDFLCLFMLCLKHNTTLMAARQHFLEPELLVRSITKWLGGLRSATSAQPPGGRELETNCIDVSFGHRLLVQDLWGEMT